MQTSDPKRIKNALLLLPRFLWYLLSLPLVFPFLWPVPGCIDKCDWAGLLQNVERMHRLGFQTESTWFWHALANANMGNWGRALHHFEKIAKPLSPIDTEASRWCWHSYVLARLGRLNEGKALLGHAKQSNWSRQRQAWVDQFLATSGNDADIESPSRVN